MTKPVDVDLKIQQAYADAFNWQGRYMLLYGGANSGKSWFIAQKLILRALQTPGERFLLIRKVYRTCHASVYQQIKDVMDTYLGIEHRKRLAKFRDSTSDIFFNNGSSMLTVGMDKEGRDKLRSIAGITSAWMEELAEYSEEDFNEVNRRVRGTTPTYAQIAMSMNPLPTGRWVKDLFIDQNVHDSELCAVKTTIEDNKYASDHDRAVLAAIRDKTERAIFLSGEWAQHTEGLIYPKWSTAEFPESDDEFWGLDFGYKNPAAVVRCAIRDVDGGPFLHVDELVYEAGLTNDQLAARIKAAGYNGEPVYCDAAEPKSIQDLANFGIRALAAEKSVSEGIKRVKEHKIRFTPSSVNLHREASLYRRQPDTGRYAEEGEYKEDPIKRNDHGMDAMRYAVFTHQGKHWFVHD